MKHEAPSLPVTPFLLAALVVLLALPLPALAQAEEAGWIPLGPRAGQPVESLALVPESPGTLLAAADQGIYRAASDGPWVFEPVDPRPVFPATLELFTSLNGTGPVFLLGSSHLYRREAESDWTVLRDDVPEYELAVAPREPSHLYLATYSPDFEDPEDGVPLRGVEVSRDGGETWTEGAVFELRPDNLVVFPSALAAGHQSPEVLYVLLAEQTDKGSSPSGGSCGATTAAPPGRSRPCFPRRWRRGA